MVPDRVWGASVQEWTGLEWIGLDRTGPESPYVDVRTNIKAQSNNQLHPLINRQFGPSMPELLRVATAAWPTAVAWPYNIENQDIRDSTEKPSAWPSGRGYSSTALLGKKCYDPWTAKVPGCMEGWLA